MIREQLVLSADLSSLIKSVWIGPLLITWSTRKDVDLAWYGWQYWSKK